MRLVRRRAGDHPLHLRQLFVFFPIGRRPDVLGMRRQGPFQSEKDRGVAGHRCRCMKEMRMKRGDLARQLPRQDQGLPESTAAVGCRIAPPIPQPSAPGGPVSGAAPHLKPRPIDPQRFLIEIFGQIRHSGADFAMDWMALAIGGMAQGKDADVEPEDLERFYFLRDKGLGQARITLEYEGDRASHGCAQRWRAAASLSAGRRPRASWRTTSLSTLRRPSSNPGTTTAEGGACCGKSRRAVAIM